MAENLRSDAFVGVTKLDPGEFLVLPGAELLPAFLRGVRLSGSSNGTCTAASSGNRSTRWLDTKEALRAWATHEGTGAHSFST